MFFCVVFFVFFLNKTIFMFFWNFIKSWMKFKFKQQTACHVIDFLENIEFINKM